MIDFVQAKIKHACRFLLAGQILACAAPASSIPWVHVDRSLSGAVCSREAMEAIARRQIQRDDDWLQQLVDCDERAAQARVREQQAEWWRDNAPWLIPASALLGAAIGIWLGGEIKR